MSKAVYTVLVVNDVFEDENLLIIKSTGEQIVVREKEQITIDYVRNYLKRNGIDDTLCKLVVIENDFTGEKFRTEQI